jgi:hypothetical protein
MKPKKDKDKEKVHKLIVGKQREKQISQGFFDGRFVERTEESKKIYQRKSKHKGEEDEL